MLLISFLLKTKYPIGFLDSLWNRSTACMRRSDPPSPSSSLTIWMALVIFSGDAGSITHHFSMELHSISDSMLITYLNTNTPFIHGFPSFTQGSSFEQPHCTAINQHV